MLKRSRLSPDPSEESDTASGDDVLESGDEEEVESGGSGSGEEEASPVPAIKGKRTTDARFGVPSVAEAASLRQLNATSDGKLLADFDRTSILSMEARQTFSRVCVAAILPVPISRAPRRLTPISTCRSRIY